MSLTIDGNMECLSQKSAPFEESLDLFYVPLTSA